MRQGKEHTPNQNLGDAPTTEHVLPVSEWVHTKIPTLSSVVAALNRNASDSKIIDLSAPQHRWTGSCLYQYRSLLNEKWAVHFMYNLDPCGETWSLCSVASGYRKLSSGMGAPTLTANYVHVSGVRLTVTWVAVPLRKDTEHPISVRIGKGKQNQCELVDPEEVIDTIKRMLEHVKV